MPYFSTFITLSCLVFSMMMIEILYSIYKQDGAYSFTGTLHNFLRGAILILVSASLIPFFTIFFRHISETLHATTSPITIVTFLTCLLLCDCMYYIFHRLHHTLPLLRQLHTVHHSDKKFNLSTAFRISWIEQSYILLFLTPVIVLGFTITLVYLCSFFLIMYQLICHSHYLTLPKFFTHLLVTPHSHRMHHDEQSEHQNSNYGAIFTIWDKLFGTFTEQQNHQTFGIKGYTEDHFIQMETKPITNYLKKHHAKN